MLIVGLWIPRALGVMCQRVTRQKRTQRLDWHIDFNVCERSCSRILRLSFVVCTVDVRSRSTSMITFYLFDFMYLCIRLRRCMFPSTSTYESFAAASNPHAVTVDGVAYVGHTLVESCGMYLCIAETSLFETQR